MILSHKYNLIQHMDYDTLFLILLLNNFFATVDTIREILSAINTVRGKCTFHL